jgi:hypothetical protein
MKSLFASLCLGVLLVAVGCGPNLEGKYKGSIEGAQDNPFAQAMGGNLSLELKGDKTFLLNLVVPIEGKWSASGTKLTLTAEKVMGMTVEEMKKNAPPNADQSDMDKPLEFHIQDGGKKLVSVENKDGALVFVRE